MRNNYVGKLITVIQRVFNVSKNSDKINRASS